MDRILVQHLVVQTPSVQTPLVPPSVDYSWWHTALDMATKKTHAVAVRCDPTLLQLALLCHDHRAKSSA